MLLLPQGSRRLFLVFAILVVGLAGLFGASASAATMPVPSKLILNVRETAGIARNGEVVRSGVPVPRSLNVLGTGGLAIVDALGTPVPAEFEVTARWNSGKSDTTAPVQWLLVTFPASVGANQTATYQLVTDGSVANPAPATRVTLTQSGNAVTVNTGAATFRLGANAGALFDEVDLADGTKVIGGGALSVATGGSTYGHSTTRAVTIEHQGPLTAIVVVQGAYDVPAIGGGQVSTRRRYVFTAGSPTAIVRHVVNWEGTLDCEGCIVTASGVPNGVRIDKAEDDLQVSLGGTPTVTAVGGFASPTVSGPVGAGQSAWVRQQLRPDRTSPQVFDVNVAGSTATGVKADGGLLAASGPAGTVAIALNHMHRYEPQALRVLPTGHLAIDVTDDKAWLANHQGLFATLAVTATPGSPSRDALNGTTWAPLNRPLRAWPDPQWFASSDAVDDFPVGPLPADLAVYDTVVPDVLNRTVADIDQVGTQGLMTFGVYPRYWGQDGYNEVDCGAGADPTPNEHWDDTFWCGAWTDYHSTVSTAPIWAMRTGDVEWLDEIAFPGALRTLHTQIMQCGPTTSWFYCGQAPAGYGAYRTDFNSSHAYFENLILYYWLTGDQTVIDIVQRGADSMRRWECPQRGPNPVLTPHGPDGPACAADYPINDPDATLTGRLSQQWQYVFRFIGLASNDASFLDDFRLNFARSITQLLVMPIQNGVTYGFWGGPNLMPETTGGNVTDLTDSQWTIGMYDMHYLNRYQRDSGDAPLGIPALKPSQVISSMAHTYKDFDSVVYGDGTVSGLWARLLQYTWTGPRLGGTLVGPVTESDRELYDPEKTGAAEVLIRAGQQEGNAALVDFGRQLTIYVLGDAVKEAAPLGKLMGQDLTRIHPAVALLTNGASTQPPPPSAPNAPSGLAAQAASSSAINLSWQDNSSNETSFRVEQLVNGAYQEVQNLAAGTTAAQVTGLAASTSYSFRVRAANSAGYSAYSNVATAATQAAPVPVPAAPTGLTAQAASSSAINLSWQDNSSNETSFRVEQLVNGAYLEVRNLAAGTTAAQITGLAASTSYSFRVRAAGASGYSAYSNVATATTPAAAPPPSPVPVAPTGLSVRGVLPGTVQLTWTDNSSNETSFRIEQLVGASYQEVYAVGANITTVQISGLNPGTGYSFRVRARNAAGNSGYSNVATGASPAGTPPPTAPQITSATALGGGAVLVNWIDNSSTEVQFVIEDSSNGITFQTAATVAANSTTVQIKGLTKAKTYFRVKAVDALGQTSYSTVMMVTVR